MKSFFLSFNTADEMDIYISYLAARNLAVLVWLFLLVWVIYDLVKTQTVGVPFIFSAITKVVYWSSILYYKKKLVGQSTP